MLETWRSMEDAGRENPLRRMPSLPQELAAVWRCFMDLDAERHWNSEAPLPIRLADFRGWCEFHGLAGPWVAEAWEIIRHVDSPRRQWLAGQVKEARNANA